jgi:WD40 repeat protein
VRSRTFLLLLLVTAFAAPSHSQQLRAGAKLQSPVPIVYATTCLNGNQVVGIGKDGDVYTWSAPFGQPRHFHSADARVGTISCSADGKWTAAGLRNGTVLVLNSESGIAQRLDVTQHDLQAIAFSADGTLLAVATNDSPTQLWDVQKGQRLATGTTILGASTAVAFASGNNMYVSADEDTTLRAYDRSGKSLFKTEADNLEPFAVVFTPDGKQFAVAGAGGTITLFDAATGHKLKTSKTNGNPIFNLMMAPSGEQVAALELDDYRLEPAAITIWDIKSNELKKLAVDVKTVVGAGTDRSNLILIQSDGPNALSLWTVQ